MPARPDDDALPLPEEGDYFFGPQKFSSRCPLVPEGELHRFYDLRNGYKHAGDVLSQYWLSQERRISNDRLLFPILYCYRHYLELSMKWILWRAGSKSDTIFKAHNLKTLWEKCRFVLRDCGADDDEKVDYSQRLILDIHEKDELSSNFRYALGRDGTSIDLSLGSVDLVRIRDNIGKLANFFDIIGTIVEVELDNRSHFL
jgi:hypothetical protein